MVKKRYLLILVLLTNNLFGQDNLQDTIKLTLRQADSTFVAQNLTLLAEKCNVEATKAQIIQARLFNNITLAATQVAYNSEYKTNGGNQWFDLSDKGETSLQVQKLFLLAGKRNKLIKLAETNANREEQNYFDLLRTLKFSLRSTFYAIFTLQETLRVYDKEISSLNQLIGVFQNQYEKGYVSKKELLRLKSTLFSLESEKLGYTTQLIGSQSDLNILLHTNNLHYIPQPDLNLLESLSPESLKLQALVDTAYTHRYDLKMVQSDLDISKLNLAYQKAVAVPDLTLSAGWDKNGGYIRNYNFIGLQFDLPFFNRNQGNIKSAKYNLESAKYKLQSTGDQVRSEVLKAYSAAVENNRLYQKFDRHFVADLEELNREMLKNYEKKNIGLVEFLDYYDAYKTNAVELNNLRNNRFNAFENINFTVGKDIIYNK